MGRPSDASYMTHLDNASLVRVGKIERDNFMWTIATKIQSSPADFGAGILERGIHIYSPHYFRKLTECVALGYPDYVCVFTDITLDRTYVGAGLDEWRGVGKCFII